MKFFVNIFILLCVITLCSSCSLYNNYFSSCPNNGVGNLPASTVMNMIVETPHDEIHPFDDSEYEFKATNPIEVKISYVERDMSKDS